MVLLALLVFVFFFFQAEDGIRDWSVTGVQTCALPIYQLGRSWVRGRARRGVACRDSRGACAGVRVMGPAPAAGTRRERAPGSARRGRSRGEQARSARSRGEQAAAAAERGSRAARLRRTAAGEGTGSAPGGPATLMWSSRNRGFSAASRLTQTVEQPASRLGIPCPKRRAERRAKEDQRAASTVALEGHRQTIHPRDDVPRLGPQRHYTTEIADLRRVWPAVVNIRYALRARVRGPQLYRCLDADPQVIAQLDAVDAELPTGSEACA